MITVISGPGSYCNTDTSSRKTLPGKTLQLIGKSQTEDGEDRRWKSDMDQDKGGATEANDEEVLKR